MTRHALLPPIECFCLLAEGSCTPSSWKETADKIIEPFVFTKAKPYFCSYVEKSGVWNNGLRTKRNPLERMRLKGVRLEPNPEPSESSPVLHCVKLAPGDTIERKPALRDPWVPKEPQRTPNLHQWRSRQSLRLLVADVEISSGSLRNFKFTG